MKFNNEILVIMGPTASGKTELSIEIAKEINGEIINTDAFQVYRKMDIGTGKIKENEKKGITHHLLDIMDYDEEFNVKIFQKLARDKIKEIISRGKKPILTGGSSLYINAIIKNYKFDENQGFELLKKENEKKSLKELQDIIKSKGITLNNSEFNNHKRLVNGVSKLMLNQELENNKDEIVITSDILIIDVNRDELYEKINNRVEKMFDEGLIDEVKQFDKREISQQAIGYKEIHSYLDGEIEIDEAISLVQQKSRNYAKKQITWINNQMEGIHIIKKGDIWIKKNY